MSNIKVIKKSDMLKRVALWSDLKPNSQMFVDTRLQEHERDLYSVIGPGVSEVKETRPAITDAQDFNLAYIGAEPGKGAALHSHPTVEVFVPLTGKWSIYWNEGDDVFKAVLTNSAASATAVTDSSFATIRQ